MGPSIKRHTAVAVIAVATSVAAAVTATAALGITASVVLVWMVVGALATTKTITLTRAVMDYRRAYRFGQEHTQWTATVMEEALQTAGAE